MCVNYICMCCVYLHVQAHTLDKNGSLYDPAGTESCNMQIRQETNLLDCLFIGVLGLAPCHVHINHRSH